MANKPKRRRMRTQSIEEKMVHKLMQLHSIGYKKAWDIMRYKEMQRQLKLIS